MSTLLEQASLVLIPSGYKEDVVYSQIPTDGAGDLSFTRASNGTRVNSAGLVEVCPWNLLEQSETFDNAVWSKTGVTVTANSVAAPNGTTTADTLVFGASSNEIVQSVGNLIVDETYTLTIYLRVASGTATMYWGNIDYTTPSITVTTEWQRFTVTQQAAATTRYPKLVSSSGVTVYAWGAQLNIGATAKPYFPTTDRLNVPRLTYQNGGGGCPSLLLEKQSTNLALWSEDFTNAVWQIGGSNTVTANAITSPDGTQNADFLVKTATNSSAAYAYQTISSTASPTATIYAKAGAVTEMMFFCQGGNGIYFNLTNGAFVAYYSAGASTITSYSSVAMGNGWYRYSMTFNTSVTTIETYMSVNTNISPSVANGNGFYVWGAQLEASSYATSYIPTTSASATRVADACSKTGISSLIGQTEGTMFVDFEFKGYDELSKWIAFLGTGSSYIGIYTDNVFRIVAEVANAGTSQFISQSFTFSVNTRYKMAIAYKANDFAFYINGTQIATDSSGTVPTTSQFSFEYNTTANNLTSRIYNQAVLFKTRLTNAELASLTTI
jgi:hypothetical protein